MDEECKNMSADTELKAASLNRDGVRLAYLEAGPDAPASPPVVFVHGWMGDHHALLPQVLHFAGTRRVVALHLRGHGDSDAPVQDYTVEGFADDVAWQCRQLGLHKPLIVGHSLGGAVTLEVAGRHPELPSGIVMIDSIMLPPPEFVEVGRQLAAQLDQTDYRAVARAQADEIYLDHVDIDDPDRKQRLLEVICRAHLSTPQHAAVSAIVNVLKGYDSLPAAKACTVPALYLDAGVPLIEQGRDLKLFKEVCPQLVVAKTYGAGHFSPLEVPDQVNAMIARFIAVGIDRKAAA
jgi:pimeloyl-ACP methyl ester carboxylesterase